MNEPADVPNKTFPCVVGQNPCSHRKAHNIYGTQMARATYHGVKDLLILKDLYNHEICLCGSTTLQSSWTGDNVHNLGAFMDSKHTSAKNVNFRNGFTGSDIGGFAEQPSGDYTRWIQLGVFILFVRHSSGDHGDQEPWAFDEEVLILPENLLTYATSCYHTYIPCFGNILKRESMLKPLVYYDQSDIQTHYRNDEFILETKF
jgi:alpha-glucosidase